MMLVSNDRGLPCEVTGEVNRICVDIEKDGFYLLGPAIVPTPFVPFKYLYSFFEKVGYQELIIAALSCEIHDKKGEMWPLGRFVMRVRPFRLTRDIRLTNLEEIDFSGITKGEEDESKY